MAGTDTVEAMARAAPADAAGWIYRRALGRFATGVVVVTTPWQGRIHGMTANAFMSGSMSPPLVVVSISRSARLAGLVRESGLFGVSVLADDHETHSRHFAGQPQHKLAPEFRLMADVPVLESALAAIAADVETAHDCGDHVLFIGKVRRLEARPGQPLVFYDGGYCALEKDRWVEDPCVW
ncbi:MAG TPA: flavin reductase family protein [Caulobacteraceae bacterium]|nr:flavin reductase family protein [Caulobacteraceae bacterium]